MSLATRVIPCLDVAGGRVVKGVRFQGLVDAGDPVGLAARYAEEGADEITFLDVAATVEDRGTLLENVDRLLQSVADMIGVNSAAIARPELIAEIADRFGAQVCVVSLDVLHDPRSPSGWSVTTHGGRTNTGIDAVEWTTRAVELGAGELLLNSIDADGTKAGYDVRLIEAVRAVAPVPLIASGGAGSLQHFAPAVQAGADAVLAASVFHRGLLTIGQVKAALADAGVPVR